MLMFLLIEIGLKHLGFLESLACVELVQVDLAILGYPNYDLGDKTTNGNCEDSQEQNH
jgi:hypothetical protein